MRRTIIFITGMLALQAGILFLFGQPPICECGYVGLWEGVVQSAGNSQHLTDWYTFSHIIHGFLLYALLSLLFPRLSIGQRVLIALAVEVGWELLENTPWAINRYREQALAQGYTGDSIINSIFDSLAMLLGFVLARRWPVALVIGIGIGLELFVAYSIRDNLMLNALNLIHVFPTVSQWQSGG